VRIVTVEYGAAQELCQMLHVQKLPTVHMYQAGNKVQDFCCPPPQFSRVQQLTEFYVRQQLLQQQQQQQQSVPNEQELVFEATLDQGRSLIQGKLEEEAAAAVTAKGLQAAAELYYSSSSSSQKEETPPPPPPPPATTKPGFWQRIRRQQPRDE